MKLATSLLMLLLSAGGVLADPGSSSPQRAADSAAALRLDTGDESAAIRLFTPSPLSPYVGAGRSQGDKDDHLSYEEQKAAAAADPYRLEAGVGYLLNDAAALNLGYRFADALPQPDKTDPVKASPRENDLQISLDIKLPF